MKTGFEGYSLNLDALKAYGFRQDDRGLVLRAFVLDNQFYVDFIVREDKVEVLVYDALLKELYEPYYRRNATGFVLDVQDAVKAKVLDIVKVCGKRKLFVSSKSDVVLAYVKERYGVDPDFPWSSKSGKDYGVLRHKENGKWFGLLMDIPYCKVDKNKGDGLVTVLNLKSQGPKTIKGVYEAYHMSHRHWCSVVLDEVDREEDILTMVDQSYQLTK